MLNKTIFCFVKKAPEFQANSFVLVFMFRTALGDKMAFRFRLRFQSV